MNTEQAIRVADKKIACQDKKRYCDFQCRECPLGVTDQALVEALTTLKKAAGNSTENRERAECEEFYVFGDNSVEHVVVKCSACTFSEKIPVENKWTHCPNCGREWTRSE